MITALLFIYFNLPYSYMCTLLEIRTMENDFRYIPAIYDMKTSVEKGSF